MAELQYPTSTLGWLPDDLEWVRSYDWQPETVCFAIARIMDRVDNDFADSDVRNCVLHWALERSVCAILQRPGAFEKSNPPELGPDTSRLLDVALELRIASTTYNQRDITFDPQWLVRLGAHNSYVASSLLTCCADEMPMFVRRGWLIDVLETMQSNRLAKLGSSFLKLDCSSLRSAAVCNPECQGLIGLWLALEMDCADSSAARREAVSMAATGSNRIANMSAQSILEQYCPAILPIWPVIRGLDFKIRAAAGIALQSQKEQKVAVLPDFELIA